MEKFCSCITKTFNFTKYFKNYMKIGEEHNSYQPDDGKIFIIQKSSTNDFNLQGDFTNLLKFV